MLFATTTAKESDPSTSYVPSQSCRHFEFPEILTATKNFDESLVIGEGGFGKVYKGNISVGASLVVAAIKRLDSMSSQGAAEFWAEVEMLSMLRHCNLVSLIGFCNYEKEMILVYEYMPNGTLSDHLHNLCSPLSWLQRLNICIGAGRGLHYLHTGTGIDSGVIHRDVKSSNILLHESWAAKISDFGLSKIGPTNQPFTYVNTHIKGTFGYLDPNYFTTGKLTRKSDVYSFGVVLLEVLCRKRAVDRSLDDEQWGLVTWAQDSIKEGNLKGIIDSDIRREISTKCLKKFIRITERCLHNSPKQRPTMAEVVVQLESALALQEESNNSLQAASRKIFGRMVNMFPFHSNEKNSAKGDLSPSVKEFRFDDLKKATREFSPDMLLGEGGSWKVFLGWVDQNTLAPSKQGDGIAVAVKRFNQEYSLAEFDYQVGILRELAHPNFAKFLGYCGDEHEHLLVYEYMPNKSFDLFLFKDAFGMTKPLSWTTRLLIMIGVARGLTYLHSEKLIHGDLRSSHILVDEGYNAKLGDFGLVEYSREKYLASEDTGRLPFQPDIMAAPLPWYMTTSFLTLKMDIYDFGVVLLESITGRRAYDPHLPEGPQNLVEWANWSQSNSINVKEIMDPRLEHNYPLQGALECIELALRCVADGPRNRPSSVEVLQSLEQIYALNKR